MFNLRTVVNKFQSNPKYTYGDYLNAFAANMVIDMLNDCKDLPSIQWVRGIIPFYNTEETQKQLHHLADLKEKCLIHPKHANQ